MSPRNEPTNCLGASREGIRYWGECIFLLIVPGQTGQQDSGGATKRREFSGIVRCNGLVNIESMESALGERAER